ncbi:Hypothetical protein SRAE_1000077000 [Strongyloides ratti]|uniref:Uncharacterized protein n=1 Tax=Strongyloides ratti TaxID=34506 RepID=A0A090KYA2_STRRB|nr:Hypothetical protein SRAE_1000077000 [Strongyloides ratti]CEF62500.1 Hypothetical protein SRAE_1000077000 [Strongyloides ratti]
MENVDLTLVSNESWVDLYRECVTNPQVMKKKLALLYKRKSEIPEAVKILSVHDMIASITNSEFLEKREGTKIAANFYYSIGPNLFRKTFGNAILNIKSDTHYKRYAELLISTFSFVKSTVSNCSLEEQDREIDIFIALVVSKIFELAIFAEDSNIQNKFMNLFEAICDKSREVSKTNGNAVKGNIINNAQLLLYKGTLEFLWLDYSLRHKLDRLNTAIMLTHMFPINPKLKVDSSDVETCFMLQVTALKRLIMDPFVPIRAFLAKEFLGVLGRGWFQLDGSDLREIISLFIDKLSNESVAIVRAKVYDGIGLLSAYPFTGSCIAKIMRMKIPFILRDADKSAKSAGLNCLDILQSNEVITLDTNDIKEFIIVLEVEKDMSIVRRIVRLIVKPLFDHFFEDEKDIDKYLNVFKEHFTKNRFANYLFHKWIQMDNLLNINAILKHVRNLMHHSLTLLMGNLRQESSLSDLTPYEASQLKSQQSENLDVVNSFIEAAATLYDKGRKQLVTLNKKKAIETLDNYVLKLHSIAKDKYKNSQVYQTIMTLLEYVGNDAALDERIRMLRSIENFGASEDVVMEYFDRCIHHKPLEILDFINKGTDIIKYDNKIKNPNGLNYFEKIMDYCAKLFYSTKTRNLIMKEWMFYVEHWTTNLESILSILESRCQISNGEEFFFSDDLIIKTLKIKFISSIIIDCHKNSSIRAVSENNSEEFSYKAWQFWMQFHSVIERHYTKTSFASENDGVFKEKLFLFGLETFKEFCTCYEFNDFCVQQTSSWLNTLNNVNAPETILISLLKIYPEIIDAMYHGPDLYDSIRNVLYHYLIDIKPWIFECVSTEDESSQKMFNEITRLWGVINNKFKSLVLLNLSPLELDL